MPKNDDNKQNEIRQRDDKLKDSPSVQEQEALQQLNKLLGNTKSLMSQIEESYEDTVTNLKEEIYNKKKSIELDQEAITRLKNKQHLSEKESETLELVQKRLQENNDSLKSYKNQLSVVFDLADENDKKELRNIAIKKQKELELADQKKKSEEELSKQQKKAHDEFLDKHNSEKLELDELNKLKEKHETTNSVKYTPEQEERRAQLQKQVEEDEIRLSDEYQQIKKEKDEETEKSEGQKRKESAKNLYQKEATENKTREVFTKLSEKISSINTKHDFFGVNEKAQKVSGAMPGISDKVSSVLNSKFVTVIDKLVNISDIVNGIRKSLTSYVDTAASYLGGVYGVVNANLEGTGKSFNKIYNHMVKNVGTSSIIKQTDYLNQIASLTNMGISYNVEERALLQTIRDKTVSAFDVTNANLLRLVRLQRQSKYDQTSQQFGLEAILKRVLNSQFGDSSYLREMFSSIIGEIQNAVSSSNTKDTTEFSGTIQAYLGAMYEAGMDNSTINKIANALDALGSGNLSSLNSDQDMQRLILLSMDKAGMNYADILQNGLNTSTVNTLLNSMIEYLADIADSTKNNKVLEASYANLYGLSMSDMKSIQNLEQMGVTSVNSSAFSSSKANAEVSNQINKMASNRRTLMSERINNVLKNMQFSFGASIAQSPASYATLKIANGVIDLVNSFGGDSGKVSTGSAVLNKVLNSVKTIANIASYGAMGKGFISVLTSAANSISSVTNGDNTLLSFYNSLDKNGTNLSGKSKAYGSSSTSSSASTVSTAFAKMNTGSSNDENLSQVINDSSWNEDEEDKTLVEIKKIREAMTSVIVAKGEKEKAVAVFIEGMTDEALRSWASIFADEDAMEDTFKGKNNTLKDALFDYAGKTTTKSSKTVKKKKSSK